MMPPVAHAGSAGRRANVRPTGSARLLATLGLLGVTIAAVVACVPGRPPPPGHTPAGPSPDAGTAVPAIPSPTRAPPAVSPAGAPELASPAGPRTPSRHPAPAPQVWGYVPNFDRAAAWAAAEVHRQTLTGISLFQYHLDEHGALIAYPDQGTIPAWLAAHGLPVVPVIANSFAGAWQRDVVARVLGDATLRGRHIERIVALAVEGGHPGVEIDYESLAAADREPFSRFIEELAVALHARGKHLAVAVHAKRSEPGEWAGPQAQDWRRIGAAADRIVVLAYDYDPRNPSPIAPLAWAREVLLFAVSQIPPAKVIQGIPLYGYSWSGSAAGVGGTYGELLARAREHGVQPRRDPRDRHLAFAYDADGATHRVWLVDADTVLALRAIGRDLHLGGVALWRLGGEDTAVWSVLGGGSP